MGLNSKIRILFVVGSLDVGGMERLIIDMLNRLDRSRYHLTVCTIEKPGKLAELIDSDEISVKSLECEGGVSTSAVLHLSRLLREADIDIIHSHNEKAHTFSVLANMLQLRRLPLIHTKHGRSGLESKRAILRNRFCAAMTDTVVAVSKDVYQLSIEVNRVSPRKMCTIVNGVAVDDYVAAAKYRSEAQVVTFGHVGRLVEVKNQAMMLRVLKRVRGTVPDAKLILVGDGPLMNELRSLANELGLDDCTDFLGYRDDIPSIVASLDCFVLTSTSEGTPLAVIEAMAAQCPVISTDVGGLSDVVSHGVSGYLVPLEDEDAMAAAWIDLAQNPDRRRQFGLAGQEAAISRFGISAMLEEYESHYQKLAGG